MNLINAVAANIQSSFENSEVTTSVILSVLLVTLILSIYEYIVYLSVSHRSVYNRAFQINLAVIPFFISMIILCLQSNLVITLGTIGALAIIRYRTAVKDPVDMLYILWSVFIGIICGCRLYEVAILTSLLVTLVLIVLENLKLSKKPLIIVFDCSPENEESVLLSLKSSVKRMEIKSRTCAGNEMHDTVEVIAKDSGLPAKILKESQADRFSIISYDAENIL